MNVNSDQSVKYFPGQEPKYILPKLQETLSRLSEAFPKRKDGLSN